NRGDCNSSAADGCETDLTASVTDCGQCGHSCLGGACLSSVCQPVHLAGSQVLPAGIRVDATSVYWTNIGTNADGTVLKIPLEGGSTVTIATGQDGPYGIAVDSSKAYWADEGGGTVNAASIGGGGSIIPIATQQGAPTSVVVDTNNVYWSAPDSPSPDYSNNGPGVFSASIGGYGAVNALSAAESPTIMPYNVALVSGTLYWNTVTDGSDGLIFSVAAAGGPVQTLVTEAQSQDAIYTQTLAVTSTHI